jgi:hypothetical protein
MGVGGKFLKHKRRSEILKIWCKMKYKKRIKSSKVTHLKFEQDILGDKSES